MLEEQKARVDESMLKLLDDVDKFYLRKLQGNMHRCMAKCCDDQEASVSSVKKCIENCGVPVQDAQRYVQAEFDHLQNRLQRCIMTCNDTIRDKIGVKANQQEVSMYTKEFESCAMKCVDSHLDLIPATLKQIKEILNQKEFSSPNY